ncbi:MAG: hypothetical protein Q7Q73_13230 [Verrucomicrobiota bacterium JB024]|nr:hypothetical protein [Verrucomicrobiota bacterium JB024]
MPATKLPLLLSPGWQMVSPRSVGIPLLWQAGAKLMCGQTDFAEPVTLGEVGLVDCPVAFDPGRGLAYGYASPQGRQREDFSELRAWHLDQGTGSRLFRLGLNQWALWLLRYLPRHDALLALVATDMPGEGVNIQHQLVIFDLAKMKSLLVSLPRDAFLPLDLHPTRREVLFYGVEGYQVVEFSGKRLRRLAGPGLPEGRGGCYHPSGDKVLLGGSGIVLWDLVADTLDSLHPRGHYPVWDGSGEGFWFSESSGDVFYYSLAERRAERVLALAANVHPDIRYARAPVLTGDGRYLATCLTRRVKRSAGSEPDAPLYRHDHCLCVLDAQTREVWQLPGPCRNAAWAEAGEQAKHSRF